MKNIGFCASASSDLIFKTISCLDIKVIDVNIMPLGPVGVYWLVYIHNKGGLLFFTNPRIGDLSP